MSVICHNPYGSGDNFFSLERVTPRRSNSAQILQLCNRMLTMRGTAGVCSTPYPPIAYEKNPNKVETLFMEQLHALEPILLYICLFFNLNEAKMTPKQDRSALIEHTLNDIILS